MKVVARCYDDRGDPSPPKNWRVEIELSGRTFEECRGAGWCTEEEAKKRVKEIVGALYTETFER